MINISSIYEQHFDALVLSNELNVKHQVRILNLNSSIKKWRKTHGILQYLIDVICCCSYWCRCYFRFISSSITNCQSDKMTLISQTFQSKRWQISALSRDDFVNVDILWHEMFPLCIETRSTTEWTVLAAKCFSNNHALIVTSLNNVVISCYQQFFLYTILYPFSRVYGDSRIQKTEKFLPAFTVLLLRFSIICWPWKLFANVTCYRRV